MISIYLIFLFYFIFFFLALNSHVIYWIIQCENQIIKLKKTIAFSLSLFRNNFEKTFQHVKTHGAVKHVLYILFGRVFSSVDQVYILVWIQRKFIYTVSVDHSEKYYTDKPMQHVSFHIVDLHLYLGISKNKADTNDFSFW